MRNKVPLEYGRVQTIPSTKTMTMPSPDNFFELQINASSKKNSNDSSHQIINLLHQNKRLNNLIKEQEYMENKKQHTSRIEQLRRMDQMLDKSCKTKKVQNFFDNDGLSTRTHFHSKPFNKSLTKIQDYKGLNQLKASESVKKTQRYLQFQAFPRKEMSNVKMMEGELLNKNIQIEYLKKELNFLKESRIKNTKQLLYQQKFEDYLNEMSLFKDYTFQKYNELQEKVNKAKNMLFYLSNKKCLNCQKYRKMLYKMDNKGPNQLNDHNLHRFSIETSRMRENCVLDDMYEKNEQLMLRLKQNEQKLALTYEELKRHNQEQSNESEYIKQLKLILEKNKKIAEQTEEQLLIQLYDKDKELSQLRCEMKKLNNKYSQLKSQMEGVVADNKIMLERLDQLNKQLLQTRKLSQMEKLCHTQLKRQLETIYSKMREQHEQMLIKNNKLEQELEKSNSDLDRAKEQIQDLNNQIISEEEKEDAFNIYQQDMKQLEMKYNQGVEKIYILQQALEIKEDTIQKYLEEKELLVKQSNIIKEQLKSLKKDIQDLTQHFQIEKYEENIALQDLKNKLQSYHQLQQQCNQKEEEILTLSQQMNKLKQRMCVYLFYQDYQIRLIDVQKQNNTLKENQRIKDRELNKMKQNMNQKINDNQHFGNKINQLIKQSKQERSQQIDKEMYNMNEKSQKVICRIQELQNLEMVHQLMVKKISQVHNKYFKKLK